MLEIHGLPLSLSDLWSLVPPAEISSQQQANIVAHNSDFVPGWLTDHVINNFTYLYLRFSYV